MSDQDKRIVQDYIVELQGLLWLRDWQVTLLDEVCIPERNADIYMIPGRKLAEMRLRHDFRAFTKERQRHTITHELLHLHFASAMHVIDTDLLEHATISNHGFLTATFMRQLELGIDGVADAIDGFMPFINWTPKSAPARKR